eukprot:2947593-Rhodomonas_salina.4
MTGIGLWRPGRGWLNGAGAADLGGFLRVTARRAPKQQIRLRVWPTKVLSPSLRGVRVAAVSLLMRLVAAMLLVPRGSWLLGVAVKKLQS